MQLSLLLPILLYIFSHWPAQAKIGHILMILGCLLIRYLVITQTYSDLSLNNIPTTGLVNPARNLAIFQKLYVMPNEHFIAFISFGATSGYTFFHYMQFKQTSAQEGVNPKVITFLSEWKKSVKSRLMSSLLMVAIFLGGSGMKYMFSI